MLTSSLSLTHYIHPSFAFHHDLAQSHWGLLFKFASIIFAGKHRPLSWCQRLNSSQTMSSIHCSTFSISSFAIFLYVFLVLTHSLFIEATCYYPDGTTATNDFPCTKNSTVDADYCCGEGFMCLTNKLCLENDGAFFRGSCTDRSWSSTACPSFCISGNPSLEVLHNFTLMTLRNHRKSTWWHQHHRVPVVVFRKLVLCK